MSSNVVNQYPPPYPGNTNTTVVVTQPYGVRMTGGCPYCGGALTEQFTILGIILCVLFFPLGILCCLCLMERRCSYCGR